MDKRLELIEQIVSCTACELSQKTTPVAFYGPTTASVAIVAEAPGGSEEKQGKPLIGPAGQKLREHLSQVGFNPDELFYFNTVSCNPHGTPTPVHVTACAQNKHDQLALVDPKWLLILGKVALKSFRPELEISKSRGRPFAIDVWGRQYKLSHDETTVGFATYHPSAALRNGVYEKAMHEDLVTFKAMVDDGNWFGRLPEKCMVCPKSAEWIDYDATEWCEDHLPPAAIEWRKGLDRWESLTT